MTSASIDGVAIRAAKYAVDNFVPVVGGMFSDTMDTLVGCTLIVKNALGVAAVLVLIGALVGADDSHAGGGVHAAVERGAAGTDCGR